MNSAANALKVDEMKLRRWHVDEVIRPVKDLPVLKRWLDQYECSSPLSGVTALMLQHQLGNQVPQTEALIRLGLDPKNIFWIDIPYTSIQQVRNALMNLGIPAENFITHQFRLLGDYAPYQRLRVQKFLRTISCQDPEHLLVLDDGAYFLEAVACQNHSLRKISIVEQTTRGLIKMEENTAMAHLGYCVPIVNVAGSKPKMQLEPPFIGHAVCDALIRQLGNVVKPTTRDRCLILGYGAIGTQVALFAQRSLGYLVDNIHVYDSNQDRMKAAINDGYSALDKRSRHVRFTLVIGCSGRASFRVGDHVLLEDGAYLASATSGTVELSREGFIELAEASEYDDIWIERSGLDESNLHSNIEFHLKDRNAVFVNGGFPVNFDGALNCVPHHYIQPTPTMMCAAALQAVGAKQGGLVELDREFCHWVTKDFRQELGDEARFLGV